MSYKRSRATFESGQLGPPSHAPFALYGTPLPAFESDARDDGSFVPEWKQTVTDERGRKRLHGAFTGGWSAGYFNTVGSKEGWTPATFVSSRTNRVKDVKDGKPREQRPEDFMDEEDLALQAESQKLETQHAFAGLGGSEGSGATKGMFAELFRSTGETIGTKLLQRMGWRHGEGMGRRVKRRARGDDNGDFHLFAPDNSRMIRFIRKTDRQGLGYAGESGSINVQGPRALDVNDEDDDSGDDARMLRGNRSKLLSKSKPLKKGAFGVGVLNDTGSDDEDPYSVGPRISYNRTLGGGKKMKQVNKKSTLGPSRVGSNVIKPTYTSTTAKIARRVTNLAGLRRCHDGRLPLDGFILSVTALPGMQENPYPPPDVPQGWTSSKHSSNVNAVYQSTADAAKSSTLDAKSRAVLLGEQQLPGKSIFDFMSSSSRNRLATASGNTSLPPGLGESAPAGFEQSPSVQRRSLWDLVPSLDKDTAAAALQRGLNGWMPYTEDETKQARYRYFLELSCGSRSDLPEKPLAFSNDEWAKELREFADAAEIFRPVSGIMASRFTSSSDAPKLASDAPDNNSKSALIEEDPSEKAAKLGMYGPLTRSTQPFYPTRLLCKRFNVRPPVSVSVETKEGEGRTTGEPRKLDLVGQANLDRIMREANFKPPSFASEGTQAPLDQDSPMQERPAVVETERNEALEGQRAGEAVFKAIFGSDDEDD